MRKNHNQVYSDELVIAASQQIKEKTFWKEKLGGEWNKSNFPFDYHRGSPGTSGSEHLKFRLSTNLYWELMMLSKESDHTLYVIITTALVILLNKYTQHQDILIGAPIYRQKTDTGMINRTLVLRTRLEEEMTVRQLLLEMKQTIFAATDHYNYPMELLAEELNLPMYNEEWPFFDIAIMLKNIHDETYIRHINTNITFVFSRNQHSVDGEIKYNSSHYRKETIERISRHFNRVLEQVLSQLDAALFGLDILLPEEKKELLDGFNQTQTEYPVDKTIQYLFAEQVQKRPHHIALLFGDHHLTYRQLNKRANRLARLLIKKGVGPNIIVGIMLERSLDMIISILAILKAGGAYLPLEPESPQERTVSLLEDGQAPILLTKKATAAGYSFSALQGLKAKKVPSYLTPMRPQITDIDGLPFPDRSLVNYEKYHQYIGVAMAKHTIPILGSRGCPYHCAYCHKIWPNKQIMRSAENIFEEVSRLYHLGIRRFVLLDDIFNLNIKNSSRFYQLILKHGLKLHLFFPGGVRGDILTKEYIDLMIEAGTINLMMALESASPRIQKLVGKHLKINRFRENLEYIIKKYPQVILETNIIMGFPTETREEARMSLDFIKQHQWIDFPNLNILKIYANTDMERLALESGISRKAIENSFSRAYHELPETLPFDNSFVLKCQAELFNEYFLKKERLLEVLPYQMKVLSEDEMVQKYDSYLPREIKSFPDLLDFFGITGAELGTSEFLDDRTVAVPEFHEKVKKYSPAAADTDIKTAGTARPALRILLLDLSKAFSTEGRMLYNVTESPLGLIYLLSYLNQQLGSKIQGKIAHAMMDFDNYEELKAIIEEFRPDIIGVRTITFFKDSFHQTIAAVRQWGIDVPIIAGGPYATSDWEALLQDSHIDLAVIGEGEITFAQLVEKVIVNNGKLPPEEVLKDIPGLAFIPQKEKKPVRLAREVLLLDQLQDTLARESTGNPESSGGRGGISTTSNDLAYVIFTSGSTGKPKGTLTTHYSVVRVVRDTNYIDLVSRDRILQLSNYAFDGSIFDIYGALLNGAGLVMMSRDDVLVLDRLSHLIKKQAITVFFITTALFNALVYFNPDSLENIRHVLFGGEKVSIDHTRRALNRVGKGKILHVYGPTETTVYATFYLVNHIQDHQETIPIGKPLANTLIYILDWKLKPAPLGVPGQVCIGGRGTALGYLNNPELTAEKFSANPFVREDRIYLSGDLAKWLPTGNIEFIGRLDHQVKLRGFRVELGEIESQLLEHNGIKDVAVVVKTDKSGDKCLCAYVVARKESSELSISELRAFLAERLPEYMIPAYFVLLDCLPLTPNGKVDRKALPTPDITLDKGYMAPRYELEKALVKIWSDVLALDQEKISIDANFFELGGHSLKATILVSKIHKAFNMKIPMAEIFVHPTIKRLAQTIKAATANQYASIKAVEEKEYFELSSAQKRLYVLQRMEHMVTSYNIPAVFELEGVLDIPKMEKAVRELIESHESFRTSFQLLKGIPVQRIHRHVEVEIEYDDAKRKAQSAERKEECHAPSAMRYASTIKNFIRPFDLSRAPLLRVGLMELPHTPAALRVHPRRGTHNSQEGREHKYILMVDMHHITADGTSIAIFINDFMVLYGGNQLPGLHIRYKDYSEWQNKEKETETIKHQEKYWLNQFPGEIPILNLTLDYPRPLVQSFEGKILQFEIQEEVTTALKSLALKEEVTLFMLLLSITNILLSKLSGQEEIIIGTPIAARRHADLQPVIGMFVNTMALPNKPSPGKTFKQFLTEIKENTLEAYENQEYPFEDLVEKASVPRDASRNPLFDAMFILQNMEITEIEIPGLKLKPYEYEQNTSKFDLTLIAAEKGKKLLFTVEYCTKLFKEETILRYITYFKKIIFSIQEDSDMKIAAISIVPEEEKQQILHRFNETSTGYAADKTLHELFQEQAEQTPDYIAVIGSSQIKYRIYMTYISYRELNDKSNQLAYVLKEKDVKPDTIVGIKVERSIEMIIGIFAILKAGGAYLPIDPQLPAERINYMLSDSNANLLLTTREIAKPFSPEAFNNCPKGTSSRLHLPPRINAPATSLAYVIYTSGSTGKPKGVMINHQAVHNFIIGMIQRINFTPGKTILALTTISFDIFVLETLLPLLQGLRIVIADERQQLDIHLLEEFIVKSGVDMLQATPTRMRMFTTNRRPASCLRNLKEIMVGGEPFPGKLLGDLKQLTFAMIYNMYGPTETTVWSTMKDLTPSAVEEINIGQPIANTQIYILDKYDQPQPLGVIGDLYIGGDGLARGYINRPELTAEHFCLRWPGEALSHHHSLQYPITPSPHHPIYKTGDLARWLPDGNIEFIGRLDFQVKLRGFRIELGEIESTLRNHPDVQEAAVTPWEETADIGDNKLVAYVVPDPRSWQIQTQAQGIPPEQEEQVADWQSVFNDTYEKSSPEQDPAFNISGWNSSYTGQPFPAEEMRVWVESTVERILSLQPQKVLEIGCGTGLLMFRIIPHCRHYTGTDISQKGLDYIQYHLKQSHQPLSDIHLKHQPAHEFSGINKQNFDLVILNSVVQYFPNIEYLLTVIDGALNALRPGGRIFIGDLRSLPLLELFHTSVEYHQTHQEHPTGTPAEDVSKEQLLHRVKKRISQEHELIIDPRFFLTLKHHYPQITHVECHLKRGKHRNELTKFRYDVILYTHLQAENSPPPEISRLHWQKENLTLDKITHLLKEKEKQGLTITNVPNLRLAEDIQILDWLYSKENNKKETGVDPETFWELSRQFPYDVSVTLSPFDARGSYHVIFTHRDKNNNMAEPLIPCPVNETIEPLSPLSPGWGAYANNPLLVKITAKLEPDLRHFLKERLPEYMIPAYFCSIDKIPLTANGKIDRKALPKPELKPGEKYLAPRDEIEKKMVDIWSEILGVGEDVIGIEDNFFHLGGHSLIAITLIAKINQELNVKLPLSELFKSPTIKKLSLYVQGAEEDKFISIYPTEEKEYYPLSPAQKRLYVMQQIEPGKTTYNMPAVLVLEGKLDRVHLENTFKKLIHRHKSLKTAFEIVDDQPVQKIYPRVEFKIEYYCAEHTAQSAERNEERHAPCASRWASTIKNFIRPFDLAKVPQVRIGLIKTKEQEHIFMTDMHHIIGDGMSTRVIVEELFKLYLGETLSPLRLQYKDYSQWQNHRITSGQIEKQQEYWLNEFRGKLPVLDIPTDYQRPAQKKFSGSQEVFIITPGEAAVLRELSRREHATMFMVILTLCNILFFKLTLQEDIIIGTIDSGRRHPDLDKIIGVFVNTLALRNYPKPHQTFIEFFREVRKRTLDAFENQDYQFEDLVEKLKVERDTSRNPLFDVVFSFNQPSRNRTANSTPGKGVNPGGLNLKIRPYDGAQGNQAKFDILFTGSDTGEELVLVIEYSTELFKAETIKRFIEYFKEILSAVVTDESIQLKDIQISHHLVMAASSVYQSSQSEFDF